MSINQKGHEEEKEKSGMNEYQRTSSGVKEEQLPS